MNKNWNLTQILAISGDLEKSLTNTKNKNIARIFNNFFERCDTDATLSRFKKIEFPNGLDFFNVSTFSSETLEGKLVVLNFFTYSCTKCMHTLAELQALEELFPVSSGLVVVGVHGAMFENQMDHTNVMYAIQRLGISHTVANDAYAVLRDSLGISFWPSLLVLNPAGIPILLLIGEYSGSFLKQFTTHALRYYRAKGDISPLRLSLNSHGPVSLLHLRFPAKIVCFDNKTFAIADAGNNRILVFNHEGHVLFCIGGFDAGFVDGNFENARFNAPQGLDFLEARVLVVADTGNHAIRQINLDLRRVETLVGTGQEGKDRIGGKIGPLQVLSSPWDVAVYETIDRCMLPHSVHAEKKKVVLLSMAGTHQIWCYFPQRIYWWKYRLMEPQTCVPIIGSGIEGNSNCTEPESVELAQPSGIALDNDFLYIADSGSSSIRKVSMWKGNALPVVGNRSPNNLLSYGDIDGIAQNAKLQHPLAIAMNLVTGKLFVADTYNKKIKVIDPAENAIETLEVKDSSGELIKFKEPAGICTDKTCRYILVSDTNNHCIKLVDTKTMIGKQFRLRIHLPVMPAAKAGSIKTVNDGESLTKLLPMHTYARLELQIVIHLGHELSYTEEAEQRWEVKRSSASLDATETTGQIIHGVFKVDVNRINALRSQNEEIKFGIALSLRHDKGFLTNHFSLIVRDSTENKGLINLNDPILKQTIDIYCNSEDISF